MKASLLSLLAAGTLVAGCAAPDAGLPPDALTPRIPEKAPLPAPSTGGFFWRI